MDKQLNKVYCSPVIKLFLRFLKDNDIIINERAYKAIFGYKSYLQTLFLPGYYIGILVDLKVINWPPLKDILELKMKWYQTMLINYKAITKDDKYLAPFGVNVTIIIPTKTSIREEELKIYIRLDEY